MSSIHGISRLFSPLVFLAILIAFSQSAAEDNQKFHGKGHGHHQISSKAEYDSLFNSAVGIEESAEGREVLDQCLAAYGGLEHLKKLKSVQQHWRMLPLMSQDSVDVVRSAAYGRRYKIYRTNPAGFESRMILGNKAWFQTADTTVELDNGRYKAELFSYLVLSMPLALKSEPFNEIRYGHRSEDPLHYIYLTKTDSLMMIIGIDPEDFLIKKAKGLIRQGEQAFVFENEFSNHREVDGYIFPHSLTNISMGLTVGQSDLEKVIVNFEQSDSDFMPAGTIGD